jgi:hypothetical protein
VDPFLPSYGVWLTDTIEGLTFSFPVGDSSTIAFRSINDLVVLPKRDGFIAVFVGVFNLSLVCSHAKFRLVARVS